jgi:hypothetical protein
MGTRYSYDSDIRNGAARDFLRSAGQAGHRIRHVQQGNIPAGNRRAVKASPVHNALAAADPSEALPR